VCFFLPARVLDEDPEMDDDVLRPELHRHQRDLGVVDGE
jgi:hypothetical protein